LSAATRPSVYTIAPEAAFADALAKGLIDRAGGDPLVLARAQILLPSRRAVRALTDAFVRCADGGLLLPRMTPLGDIDVDDALDMVAGLETSLLPPIDPIRRRLLLTRLIRRWQAGIGSVEALRLADQLGTAFDTLAREGVDPLRLKDVAGIVQQGLQAVDFRCLQDRAQQHQDPQNGWSERWTLEGHGALNLRDGS